MTTLASTQLLFIDTNVWLYALITGQDPVKAQKARTLVARNNTIIVSTQVINEVCVNLIKREHFTAAQTRDVINDFYAVYSVEELFCSGLEVKRPCPGCEIGRLGKSNLQIC